ncbi:MAG TPA: hypothetical protein VMT22_16290 [Terriglobales bacterium]|nr:hypothetical protein [Terriglobales bacterium]
MARTPWTTFAKPNPEQGYVEVASYLPLIRFFGLCRQFIYDTRHTQNLLQPAAVYRGIPRWHIRRQAILAGLGMGEQSPVYGICP